MREFDYVIVEFFDEDFVGSIDQRFRNELNESAHISSGLGHSQYALAVEM